MFDVSLKSKDTGRLQEALSAIPGGVDKVGVRNSYHKFLIGEHMENIDEAEAIDKVKGILDFYSIRRGEIFRIISLVQDNKDFFDVRIGGSCLAAAAKKLEEMIESFQEVSKKKR